MAQDWFDQGTRQAGSARPSGGATIQTRPADPKLPGQIQGQGLSNAEKSAGLPYVAPTAEADLTRKRQQIGDRNNERTDKLRNDFLALPAVKEYSAAVSALMSGLKARPDGRGDNALIYAYAKAMDPGSVVRESEMSMAAGTGSMIESTVASLKKQFGVEGGGQLSPEVREGLKREMNSKVAQLAKVYGVQRANFQDTARRQGVNPEDVVGRSPAAGFVDEYKRIMGDRLKDQPTAIATPQAQEIDPTGANSRLSPQDRDFISANARYMTPDGMKRWYADRGMSISDKEAQDAYAYYQGGGQQDAAVNAPQGEGSFVGKALASTPGTTVGGYLNGVTMGGLDEITAGVNSIANGVPYSQALAAADQRKQALAREHPIAYGVGNLAGGLTSAVGLGALGVGSKLPLLSDIGIGAAGGALEENNNRLGGGAVGGALGGTLGMAFRGAASLRNRPTGVDLPISRTLEQAGPENVRARLEEAARLGVPMSLADADPALTALAGSATRFSPSAEKAAINSLLPRARGQVDRFGQAIERDLGPLSDPMRQSDALLEQARTAAAPLYEQAYKAPVIGTPTLDSLINTPFGRQAVGKARTIAANERRDPAAMGFRLDADGNVVLEPTVNIGMDDAGNLTTFQNPAQERGYTTQTLDYAKRGMDDVLEQYRNPITGKLDLTTAGRAENGVRADFLTELDKLNPAYAQARAAYQGPMELRDALAAGREAVRQSPREVQTIAGRSSPAEMEQMRLGYRVGLSDKANDIRYSSNPFEGVLGTPAAEQRLSAIYGDTTPGVTRLLRQRDLERDLARSTNDILGNSSTAKRLTADENFMGNLPGAAADVAIDVATGQVPVRSALGMFGRGALRDRVRLGTLRGAEKRADEIAPVLFNTDTPVARDALDDILSRTATYRGQQRLAQPIAGATGGVIGGQLPDWLLGS